MTILQYKITQLKVKSSQPYEKATPRKNISSSYSSMFTRITKQNEKYGSKVQTISTFSVKIKLGNDLVRDVTIIFDATQVVVPILQHNITPVEVKMRFPHEKATHKYIFFKKLFKYIYLSKCN